MQWSLFLLILMGQCSFFTCHLCKYHFIEVEKTWHEAQKHCRDCFTDLATVSDMTDMKRLRLSTKNEKDAWIGLSKHNSRKWHWSLPGVEYHENRNRWSPGSLAELDDTKNCVVLNNNRTMTDYNCNSEKPFICYDETQKSNKTFHVINDTMNWLNAQSYCRKEHTDLVSGFSQLDDRELQMETSNEQDSWWTGLFRDTWGWSDGSNFSFRDWDPGFQDGENKAFAVTMLNSSGKWGSDECQRPKPFLCYEDNVILIKECKTWEDALYHCRENYNDLVSITNPLEQIWIQQRARNASTDFVWMGLRYTCTLDFWFWVSDEAVHYKNWASEGQRDDCDVSGAMERGGEHKWFKKLDNMKFNFMCSKW